MYRNLGRRGAAREVRSLGSITPSPRCVAFASPQQFPPTSFRAGAFARRRLRLELGRVTHLANNHVVMESDCNGKEVRRTYRDSCDAPARAKRKAESFEASAPNGEPKHACKIARVMKGCYTPSRELASPWERVAKGKAAVHSGDTRREQDKLVRRRVDEVGATLKTPTGEPSATQKTEALLLRVRARERAQATS